ncbi:sensor domain-containing diguanylate cyclase [Noviherbaspirillum sp. UKPF54]|uniref:sensor domain-containing diguanylate cyclase n=1 Tax=Noviherbaspirillum sp. UKPF54 TaxID=2601898 RepID=UPI0011B14954|nr:sensor domain-containing diguanylate cyclase [Noviherbaspirillum sp. UKPF54]QDZ27622.1 sensor domain-containing diguanylate cyclase [Noviherbaspirillum sp. UKPF54]
MTKPVAAMQTQAQPSVGGPADAAPHEVEQQLLRIRRIGKRLFDVADCVIVLGQTSSESPDGASSPLSAEADFCRRQPLPDASVVVADAGSHPVLGRDRAVLGVPHIRFFAAHPVRNQEKVLVGHVCLIDLAPRPGFGPAERQLLADLASLVERELLVHSMSASHLDLQKKNKNLRRKSLIDPLIGTWNRGAIMRILTIEAIRCDKAGVPLSLIVADLDYFKKINDTYGHQAGDAVLVKVASRLRSCIRPQEALGRYGGEEFLIVLPGATSATAMAVAERMRQAVASQPETIGGTTFNLTISAGVASTDMFPTATTEELISRADVALYAAKDAGRNRIVKAAPELP